MLRAAAAVFAFVLSTAHAGAETAGEHFVRICQSDDAMSVLVCKATISGFLAGMQMSEIQMQAYLGVFHGGAEDQFFEIATSVCIPAANEHADTIDAVFGEVIRLHSLVPEHTPLVIMDALQVQYGCQPLLIPELNRRPKG